MNEDEKLCDDVFLGIVSRTDGIIVISAYNDIEKAIVLVYQTMGLIGNMGLAGFLEGSYDGDPDFRQTIVAYRQIGDQTMASTLEDAIKTHRKQMALSPEDDQYGELSQLLDNLDDTCIDSEDRTIDLLATYVRSNYIVVQ